MLTFAMRINNMCRIRHEKDNNRAAHNSDAALSALCTEGGNCHERRRSKRTCAHWCH